MGQKNWVVRAMRKLPMREGFYITRLLRYIRRKIRPFPYRITLRDFVARGCTFEVTTPIEEWRVTGLDEEEEFIRLLLSEVQAGDSFYDIGSCVGLFALHAALLGAKVLAFEPDPSYRNRLVRNIGINKLGDRVRVIKWGVSDTKGTALLYSDGVEGRSPSLAKVGERGSVLVDTDSIDNAITEGAIPNPNMVKLDIEGAEILALRVMKLLLTSKGAPRCLFIEFHPEFLKGFDSSVDECIAMVESFGYVREYFKPRAAQLHCVYRKKTPLEGS